MGDADATAETLLVVRPSAPRPAGGVFPAHEQQLRLDEDLAFIQSLLAQNGNCRASRVDGDELLALFGNSDAAFVAAGELQEICAASGRSPALAHLHLLLDQPADDSDGVAHAAFLPGDSVGRSQLIRQLPPDLLFATAPVIARLRDAFRARFRTCDASVDEEVDVSGLYRAIIHEDATTRIALSARARKSVAVERSLSLRWRNHTITLGRDSPSLTLGRSEQADVQIESSLASRIHARLVVQQNDFILTDQSTNGTFIQMEDMAEVCLQHEQIVLRGKGVVSLGRPISQGRGKLIYFTMNG